MPLNILVTGLGGGGLGEQMLKALRLSKKNYNIVGADITRLSSGLSAANTSCILPAASDASYVEAVLKLCKKHDIKAVFYGSEAELKKLSENRLVFKQEGIFLPLNPQSVIEICLDKNKTIEFLSNNGFKFPRSFKICCKQDLDNINIFPLVLKPSLGAGGSANTFIAQTAEELYIFGAYLLAIYEEFIVQEYIGSPENEFTVGVLSTMEGEIINSIAVKRLILNSLSNKIKVPNRTGKKELGSFLAISNGISQGEIGRFPEVTNQCIEIAKSLGSTGAINIQCRLVENDVYIFEINPRFSGTTSLRAIVGYNEPDILIRQHIFNEKILPFFEYKEGYILRGLQETFIPLVP